ncbi:hypothetical protein Nepgr_011923 [Nepenthes gracilis]|uniref:Uncharacterized protein n=1 Tax=Nepenthes gracilis TaxID=150966 RepID=A0AAD3SGD8_NEPGR|nr:hypothetical protein Nepgr_011923 [Nepenthes gracilis]
MTAEKALKLSKRKDRYKVATTHIRTLNAESKLRTNSEILLLHMRKVTYNIGIPVWLTLGNIRDLFRPRFCTFFHILLSTIIGMMH